jgi:2-dehydropantoate 2-reductase
MLIAVPSIGTIEEVTANLFRNPLTRPRFLAGVISHGTYSTSPFTVVHAGFGTTTLGAVPSPDSAYISGKLDGEEQSQYLIKQLLNAPPLAAIVVPPGRLLHAQLEKLAINAIINPLTAMFDCFNGELFNRPPILALMRVLLTEISAVILSILRSANPGSLDPSLESRFSGPVLEKVIADIGAKSARNISSMCQDVRAGRKTEIDYINGYITARGTEVGIDCRHNRTLVKLVKDRRVISEAQIPTAFQV